MNLINGCTLRVLKASEQVLRVRILSGALHKSSTQIAMISETIERDWQMRGIENH